MLQTIGFVRSNNACTQCGPAHNALHAPHSEPLYLQGRTEVVHLLHGEVDSVPQIDEVLRLYDRAGSDLADGEWQRSRIVDIVAALLVSSRLF